MLNIMKSPMAKDRRLGRPECLLLILVFTLPDDCSFTIMDLRELYPDNGAVFAKALEKLHNEIAVIIFCKKRYCVSCLLKNV